MFKIHEIGKIGFQFFKLTFSGVGEQAICKFGEIQGKYQSFSRYQIRERPIDILCIGFIDFNDWVTLVQQYRVVSGDIKGN